MPRVARVWLRLAPREFGIGLIDRNARSGERVDNKGESLEAVEAEWPRSTVSRRLLNSGPGSARPVASVMTGLRALRNRMAKRFGRAIGPTESGSRNTTRRDRTRALTTPGHRATARGDPVHGGANKRDGCRARGVHGIPPRVTYRRFEPFALHTFLPRCSHHERR